MWDINVFFCGSVIDLANWALSRLVSQRNLTPPTQPSWVLIQQSNMMLPLVDHMTMLFLQPLSFFLPQKSLHVNKWRFTPALALCFMSHYMCSFLLLLTWYTFTHSLLFFVADILLKRPCTTCWYWWHHKGLHHCWLYDEMLPNC